MCPSENQLQAHILSFAGFRMAHDLMIHEKKDAKLGEVKSRPSFRPQCLVTDVTALEPLDNREKAFPMVRPDERMH